MFSKLAYKGFTLLTIVALAIAVGSCIFAIFNYQHEEKALKAIYSVKREVQEKLLIDSILSQYEDKHRQRLDSISNSYNNRIDSLSQMLHHLKKESNVIQAELISADSLLPVY